MQGAIDRLIKGAGPGERPLLPGRSTAALMAPVEICSVPLLEMHINSPEQFTMRTVPPPAIDDNMPRAQAPAPPCDQTAPSR